MSAAMQLSPHALPFLHTLQQEYEPVEAKAAAEEQRLIVAGPTASDVAARIMAAIFMATPPRFRRMRFVENRVERN